MGCVGGYYPLDPDALKGSGWRAHSRLHEERSDVMIQWIMSGIYRISVDCRATLAKTAKPSSRSLKGCGDPYLRVVSMGLWLRRKKTADPRIQTLRCFAGTTSKVKHKILSPLTRRRCAEVRGSAGYADFIELDPHACVAGSARRYASSSWGA
jgi:hypothetical protein